MKALITGATGFLGKSLIPRLLATYSEVCCLVRPSSDVQSLRARLAPGSDQRLTFVQGTLDKIQRCAAAFEGADVIYHVAAALKGSTPVLFLNNVTATRDLIQLALDAKVKRLVLVSSLAVYGTSGLEDQDTVDESHELDANPHLRDPYTYSKIEQEKVAWAAHRERALPLVVVRPGVIYGPGRECLVGRVGLKFGNFLIRMGGSQLMPFTYVDNCADALVLAGTQPAMEGHAFNVVDDNPPTARQLVRQYKMNVGPVRVAPVPHWAIVPLSNMCQRYHVWSRGQLPAVLTPYKSNAMWKMLNYSNRKAKELLGWRPAISFDQGLPPTFAALREQGRSAKAVA
jgi:nucleoside-diphosphate-sugar epimerase